MIIKQAIKDLRKQLNQAILQKGWIMENLERLEQDLADQEQKIEDINRDIRRMEPLMNDPYSKEKP